MMHILMPLCLSARRMALTLTDQLLPPPLAKHRQIQRAYAYPLRTAFALEMAKES